MVRQVSEKDIRRKVRLIPRDWDANHHHSVESDRGSACIVFPRTKAAPGKPEEEIPRIVGWEDSAQERDSVPVCDRIRKVLSVLLLYMFGRNLLAIPVFPWCP